MMVTWDNLKIVVMTGAGISAESGLGTFRDKGGLWTKYDLEEVATPEGFARDPVKVHEFYNARRKNAGGAVPNAAHHALGRLVREHPGEVVVITQNVDHLHEAAGVEAIHMHGALARARCHVCAATWDAPEVMAADDPCPACAAPSTRPDVVWFGETPQHLDAISDHLTEADLFAVIGTSGTVWPAAGFAQVAAKAGAETVEFNLERSAISDVFDRVVLGPAGETVPVWVAEVLEG